MKTWTCVCGSKMFILTRTESTIVNFNTEGAIEGHPHISKGFSSEADIVCNKCHAKVADVVRDKMLKEVI